MKCYCITMQIKKKVETEPDTTTVVSSRDTGIVHVLMMILVALSELVTTLDTRITNVRLFGQGHNILVGSLMLIDPSSIWELHQLEVKMSLSNCS